MRLIDLFNEATSTPDRDAILVKKYTDGNCTLHSYYPDKNEVSSTLPFETMLMLADNNEMKAQYINIDGHLFDQLRFNENYSNVLIYMPRADAYGREVIDADMPKVLSDLFIDSAEKQYYVVISGKCSELANHILLT